MDFFSKSLLLRYIIYMVITSDLTVSPVVFYSEYSMQLNASRIKVLQAQDDLVNSMKEDAAKELLNVSHHHHILNVTHHDHEYKHLLKELIVQVGFFIFFLLVTDRIAPLYWEYILTEVMNHRDIEWWNWCNWHNSSI